MSETLPPPRVRRILDGLGPTRLALIAGLGLLLIRLTFALTVPLGSAPDEPDHYIKAVGAAHLDFGTRRGLPPTNPASDMERLNDSLRVRVDLGSQAINPTWSCNAFHPERPASCLDPDAAQHLGSRAITNFGGTFPPYLYVALGTPSWFISDPDTALLAMRLVVVAITSVLSGWGLVVAARRWGTRGVLAAALGATPMLLYTQGTLGTSGLESAGALAMLVSAIDVLGDPEDPTAPLSAPTLDESSDARRLRRSALREPSLDAVIAAVVVALVLAVVGVKTALRRISQLPRAYAAVAAILTIGSIAASVGSSLAANAPYHGEPKGLRFLVEHYLFESLPALWHGAIGRFEWLDTPLPAIAVIVAWSAFIGVLTWSAPERDRAGSFRMWVIVASTIGFGFLADATVFARLGGAVQARHVLPLLQLWPLIAVIPTGTSTDPDDAADRDGNRLTPLRVGALVMGATTLIGWWYVAQREAVGVNGPLDFFGDSKWRPSAGWVVPLVVMVLGIVCAAIMPGVASLRRPAEQTADPPDHLDVCI